MKLHTLQDLFTSQLEDLYCVEQKILDALPKMAAASSSQNLREEFEDQMRITQRQLERLDRVFDALHLSHTQRSCEGIEGIIHQSDEILETTDADPKVRDAALISTLQRVEHYEMAEYGSARTYAHDLGYADLENLLQTNLNEEGVTDHRLSKIAQGGFLSRGVNQRAPRK